VAGTNIAPVNTTNVDVLFSNDGGQTFPVTLASNVANSGTVSITVPSTLTSTGRVKIVPVGNFYYDVNDADITIESVLSVEESVAFSDLSLYPNPTKGIITLSFTPKSQEEIKVTLFDVRGRLIENKIFENKGRFNTQLNYSQVTSGVYFVNISIGNESSTKKLLIQ
jgi:hypothetical protein